MRYEIEINVVKLDSNGGRVVYNNSILVDKVKQSTVKQAVAYMLTEKKA